MMSEPPYTLQHVPANNSRPPRRRRSSLLDKWIHQQQKADYVDPDAISIEALPAAGTRSNPYLAYPDMFGRAHSPANARDSTLTVESYDLVDDDDIPESPESTSGTAHVRSRTPASLNFRRVSLSFRSASPAPPSPASTAKRMLFFGSGRNTPTKHSRSKSLGTPSPQPSKWRPSVLGYFSSPSQASVIPSETYAPSRPSLSSTNTCTSSNLPTKHLQVPSSMDLGDTKPFAGRSASLLSSSTGSIFRLRADNLPSMSTLYLDDSHHTRRVPLAPKPTSHLANTSVDADEDKEAINPRPSARLTQPQVAFAKDTPLARVSFSSRNQKKKKKLVISGIAPGDTRKFESAKRWCESFGEVSQIIRMPNGDLHVHFRSADVADTVCRLRAKVFIAGVGSVNLSWYTGTKH